MKHIRGILQNKMRMLHLLSNSTAMLDRVTSGIATRPANRYQRIRCHNVNSLTPDALALIAFYGIEKQLEDNCMVLVIDPVDNDLSPLVLTTPSLIYRELGIEGDETFDEQVA